MLFEKFRKEKQRRRDLNEILSMTDLYGTIQHEVIKAGDVYIYKHDDRQIIFVKKDGWKKYVGIGRVTLCDYQGGTFACDDFYESKYFKGALRHIDESIPEEIRKAVVDTLIEHKQELTEAFNKLFRSEWYE